MRDVSGHIRGCQSLLRNCLNRVIVSPPPGNESAGKKSELPAAAGSLLPDDYSVSLEPMQATTCFCNLHACGCDLANEQQCTKVFVSVNNLRCINCSIQTQSLSTFKFEFYYGVCGYFGDPNVSFISLINFYYVINKLIILISNLH
jgi:hypothetical protein